MNRQIKLGLRSGQRPPDPKIRGAEIIQTTEFESKTCRMLFDYWKTKYQGDRPPTWADITLMDVYPIAGRVFVKDAVNGGTEFRNRFWGSGLCDAFGIEASNLLISDYYEPHAVPSIVETIATAMRAPRPTRTQGDWFMCRNANTKPSRTVTYRCQMHRATVSG